MLELQRLWLRTDPDIEDRISKVQTGAKRKSGIPKQAKKDAKRQRKDLSRAKTKRKIIWRDGKFDDDDESWLYNNNL